MYCERAFLIYVFAGHSFAFQISPDFMVASEDRRFCVHSSQPGAGLRVLNAQKNSLFHTKISKSILVAVLTNQP